MPPKSPSGIPERVLSLLPNIHREKLSSLVKIKASNTTQVREESDSIQGYLRVLEQRRKFVEDDLADIPPRWNINDDAYKSLIMAKIEAACAGTPKSGTVIVSKQFKTNTLQYFGGSRLDQHGVAQVYCMMTGWYGDFGRKGKEKTPVKGVQLVPRSLEGGDLNYLFGIRGGDKILSSVENSLLLHKNIGLALDACQVIFVPEMTQSEGLKWKLVVTDQSMLKNSATERYDWVASDCLDQNLHGTYLKFLNENRPAKRYLYLRYVITYLILKKRGPRSVEWAVDNKTKEFTWAAPGPYLRQSLLRSLSRRVSDHYLPVALYQDNTFSELSRTKNKSVEEEADYTLSLANKLVLSTEVEDEEEDSSEEDSTSDEDTSCDTCMIGGRGAASFVWENPGVS
ncbi:hypothetical protein BKA61DRAFT_578691 [Leptodontidium sp. MPI-SDFR-AT-0119]|nr:hypothetical protein BKA61DRAFT_578691 [Leptodontidium sp. MPI-SDFR-AT-0119]